MKDLLRIRGAVTVVVMGPDGNVKLRAPGFWRRVFGLPGKQCVQRFHNIVTREGDALIADALLAVPTKAKVSSASGFIQVGTGWTGNSTKTNTRCNTPAGAMRALDEGYPVLAAAWGAAGDTTVKYRATFDAGSLAVNGLNEACLLNGDDTSANCMAYAQITPAVNITAADTLQIVWEITILGQ